MLAVWVYLLYHFSKASVIRKHLFPALLLKIIAGFCLGYVYHWYLNQGKGADTFGLFYDGITIAKLAKQNFLKYADFIFLSDWDADQTIFQSLNIKNPRGVIFSKWVSLFVLIAGENYWLISVFFSLLSFTGIWWLVNLLVANFPTIKLIALLSFCYWPSVVFWSSGIIKEALLMFCMCSLVALFIIWVTPLPKLQAFKKVIVFLFIFLPICYVLLILKYYYLAALLPVLFSLSLSRFVKTYKKAVFIITFVGSIVFASFLHPNLHLDFIVSALVKNNQIMVAETNDTANLIGFQELEVNVASLIKNVPIAIFEGWFRPYFWEDGNLWKKVMGIESLLLSILTLLAIIPPLKFTKDPEKQLVILAVFCFCSLLLIMLTFAAPNLGNLVRYKSAFLPFALLLIFSSIQQKLSKLIQINN